MNFKFVGAWGGSHEIMQFGRRGVGGNKAAGLKGKRLN